MITGLMMSIQSNTAGCVAVSEAELIDIIGWLDPAKKLLIITGNEEELEST